jgi:hypothetical protein
LVIKFSCSKRKNEITIKINFRAEKVEDENGNALEMGEIVEIEISKCLHSI